MAVDLDAKIIFERLLQDVRHMPAHKADMMLESVLADVFHKLLAVDG